MTFSKRKNNKLHSNIVNLVLEGLNYAPFYITRTANIYRSLRETIAEFPNGASEGDFVVLSYKEAILQMQKDNLKPAIKQLTDGLSIN